jgi:predicted N-acyltransferase
LVHADADVTDEDYVIRVHRSPAAINAAAWDGLLSSQGHPSPFMRHSYLMALHESGCAGKATGWDPHFMTLHSGGQLRAACPVYLKSHSYGEYVFDWSWANAHQQHGVPYYPKALVAVPFTPVPGTRLLATDDHARAALVEALLQWCQQAGASSLHLLFCADDDVKACAAAGLLLRHGVQFHWTNTQDGYPDFNAFLGSLSQEKRKKIKQERRRVQEAGVVFRHATGAAIAQADWDFFYRCYERTYLEHGNAPYLSPDFFHRMVRTMPDNWLLFTALRQGIPIASSLIALSHGRQSGGNCAAPPDGAVAYGRYWGCIERVDCLHFEACYYQPLQWCIANGYQRFEGGAQGEHKMARALLPVGTTSAHWLAHPAFSDAVSRFLEREGEAIDSYLDELQQRTPFKKPGGSF